MARTLRSPQALLALALLTTGAACGRGCGPRSLGAAGSPPQATASTVDAGAPVAPTDAGAVAPQLRTVFKLPDLGRQANVAQILIADSRARVPWLLPGPRKRTAAEARALADKIYGELRHGASFAAAVKQYSDWPVGARHGGEIGIVTEGQPNEVPGFDAAVFGLKVGEVAPPIEGPLGFYLFERLPLTRVARIALRFGPGAPAPRTREEALALADRIEGELRAGKPFADLAFAFSDDPSSAGRGGDVGGLEPDRLPPALRSALATLRPGQASAPVEGPGQLEILERLE